jgi:hypothetical protein
MTLPLLFPLFPVKLAGVKPVLSAKALHKALGVGRDFQHGFPTHQ